MIKKCSVAAVIVLLAAMAASGCRKTGAVGPDSVLAVVNGDKITVADFRAACDNNIPKDPKDRETALDGLIRDRIFSFKAMKEGYAGSPEVAAQTKMMKANYLPGLLRQSIYNGIKVDDSEVDQGRISSSPILDIYQIINPSLDQAEAALAELKKGAKFEDVAQKYSKGISAGAGGYIGRIDAYSSVYPAGVFAALNSLKPGEISPIIKMELGYSIFKLKSKKSAESVRKEAVEQLRNKIKAAKTDQEMARLIEKLRASAGIQINKAALEGKKDAGNWAAKVNGMTIEMNRGLLGNPDEMLHEPHQDMDPKSVEAGLQSMINNLLLVDEAERRGLDKDEPVKKMLMEKQYQIMADVYIHRAVGTFDATAEDIQAYYDKYKNNFKRKEAVYLSRILVSTPEDARKAAGEINSGKDFAAVAAEYSIDKSRLRGGNMGWEFPDKLAEPYRSAVSKLRKGQVTPVLKTKYGYEIFKVEDHVTGGVPDISELVPRIKKLVLLQKRSEAVEKLYKDAMKGAKVKVDNELLKSL